MIVGLKEGKGVVAKKVIKPNTSVCNYGGHFIQHKYAEKHLLPFEKKCDYLLEIRENYRGEYKKFYLNHDSDSSETFGKYLNHSQIHPNVAQRIYSDGEKLEIIFVTTRQVDVVEQLVWNYGSQYKGVDQCVENCPRCITRDTKKSNLVRK